MIETRDRRRHGALQRHAAPRASAGRAAAQGRVLELRVAAAARATSTSPIPATAGEARAELTDVQDRIEAADNESDRSRYQAGRGR